MSARRRNVRPLLILQAISLVVLSVVVGAFTWQATSTYQAEVQAPRILLEKARAAGRTIGTRPYLHLATGDPLYADQTQAGITSLRAQLSALSSLRALPKKPLQVSDEALRVIEESIAIILTAGPDSDLSGALEALARGTAALDTALSTLESRIEDGINDRYRTALERLLLVWVAMLVIVLVTAVVSSRRVGANDEAHTKLLRQLDQELARALEEAVAPRDDDAPDPEPVRVSVGGIERLVSGTRKAITTLATLQSENRRMAGATSFAGDLVDALAMADTEDEVFRIAARAATTTYPEATFSLAVVDEESGRLVPCGNTAVEDFGVHKAESCPGFRKGGTLHYVPDAGLACSPVVGEDTVCSSCLAIKVDGHIAVMGYLVGYPKDQTQLDKLEVLGLAVGARLGEVRSLPPSALQATTDHLTKLANRQRLDDRIAALDRANVPYTVIAADLDHFSRINDEHGQEVGDSCLELFAKILRDASRTSDVPCRYGGEEFVVLLPKVGMRTGLSVAMRIRIMLREASRTAPTGFTVSMGIATRPEHGTTGAGVLEAANAAVHDAKESGRDQVIPAPPPEVTV